MDKSYKELIKPNRKEFWQNFWFYNKKIIIAVIVTMIIVVFTVSRCINIPRTDAGILLLTRHSRTPEVTEKLESRLEELVDDINGDGEVCVKITEVYLPDEQSAELKASNEMKAVNELVNGEATVVIAEKSLIEAFLEEDDFFEEIPEGDYSVILNSKGKAVAIDVTQKEIAKEIEYHGDDVLCLAVKSLSQNEKIMQYITK